MKEYNLEIIKHCTHFYTIINFEYYSDDLISEKLIDVYQNYIFTIDLNNKEEVEKIKKLDENMYKYISDYAFRNQIKQNISNVKVVRGENILDSLVNALLSLFETCEKKSKSFSKIVLTRWI